MMASLDVYHAYIGEDAVKCYERNGDRVNWKQKTKNDGHSYDFETDFNVLKDWLTNRIAWINENFSPAYVRVDDSDLTRGEKLFINVLNAGVTSGSSSGGGVDADFLIPRRINGSLNVEITTTSTSVKRAEVYLNGLLFAESNLTNKKDLLLEIDSSHLRAGENALNVIYVVTYKTNGDIRTSTFVTLRNIK